MGLPGRRPSRLKELAEAAGASQALQHGSMALLVRPRLLSTTAEDIKRVIVFLKRTNHGLRDKSMFLTLSRMNIHKVWPHITDYKSKATQALQQMLANQCSPGEASLLLKLGADVNRASDTGLHAAANKPGDQLSSTASSIFEKVVQSGDTNLVNALVEGASQKSLDNGLGIALGGRLRDIVTILLDCGANPNMQLEILDSIINAGHPEIMLGVSSGKVPLESQTLSRYLREMVQLRQSRLVKHLLWLGAVIDPPTLHSAIQSRQIDELFTLCTAKNPPSPSLLAEAIPRLKIGPKNAEQRLQLTEILLASGAKGPQVTDALLAATSERNYPMIKLLMDFCQPDGSSSLEALKRTMRMSEPFLFLVHLDMVEDEKTIDDALTALLTTSLWYDISEKRRVGMAIALVERKPSKATMTEALRGAVNRSEVGLVHLLLERGAEITSTSGDIILAAIKQDSMEILAELLLSDPPAESLTAAMKHVEEMPIRNRYSWTKALAEGGAKQSDINRAMGLALQQSTGDPEHYELIKMLSEYTDKVDVGDTSGLVAAIHAADIATIEMLQQYIPKGADMDVALAATNTIRDLDQRYKVFKILLKTKPLNTGTTNALISVLDLIPREKRFSRLLVTQGRPDVNLAGGRILVQAITHEDIELVGMLVKRSPTKDTLRVALHAAMITPQGPARVKMCQILVSAGATGTEMDQALLRATVTSPCDMELIKLFIAAGASIDHKNGSVVQLALQRRELQVLDLLLARPASRDTLLRAVKYTLSIQQVDDRKAALKSLMNARTASSPKLFSELLRDEIHDVPK